MSLLRPPLRRRPARDLMPDRSLDRAVAGRAVLPRPTGRAAVPFVVVGLLGLTSVLLPPFRSFGDEVWLMAAILAVAVVAAAVSVSRRTRTWVDPVAPALFLVVVALARDATGGAQSEVAPLVTLPLLWLALTGNRRDLRLATVLTFLVFALPPLLVGGAAYPVTEWRRALLWTAFAAFVCPVVQSLVYRLATESARSRTTAAEMDSILAGASLSALIGTDLDGTVRSFSRGAVDMLRLRAEDVVGTTSVLSFHVADEVERVAAELGVGADMAVFRALAAGRASSRQWAYLRPDGTRLTVRLALTELRDGEGQVTGYLAVAIDVTEAVAAQAAVAAAELRWRLVADHLPGLTVMAVDDHATMLAIAGTGAMAQGFRGMEGHRIDEFSTPENMTLITEGIATATHEGRETTVELRASANGAEHEVTFTPLPELVSGERQTLIVARNVSVEREREREVVRARQQAERLFDDAPHGVAVLSLDGRVVRVNEALQAMMGPGARLRGHPLADLAAPGEQRLARHLEETVAERGERVATACTLTDARGEELHVALTSRVLAGEDGAEDLVLCNVIDVSERHRYEQQLAHLADHDVLTGLPNRRQFDAALQRHLAHCERYGDTGALLLLDLDHFKEVNDSLGHAAGDQLLISMAALLGHSVRSTDLVARLGGDEFAVLLSEGGTEAARVVASTVVERVRERSKTLDGTLARVTCSVGVVTFTAAREHDADVLALADITMYDAKDAGRDRYAILEVDAGQPALGVRVAWSRRLEAALQNGAFTLHLQPILDLATGRVRSAEALVRLHDTDELMLPAGFLYIAERSHLISALDAWVVRRSVAMLARLRQVEPDFRLEVNLSGRSLSDAGVLAAITESLCEHGVDPAALTLEISEIAAVADVAAARGFAERMAELGCRFALDDFGAGFGSFYSFKHLVFDAVKIDGEFVTGAATSETDRAILRSIVGVARGLGKQTVAEHVEKPAVLAAAREAGVDQVQGYLVGKPVVLEEFVALHLANAPALPALPALPSGPKPGPVATRLPA